jgi:excisionase family DNA binding protein
MGLQSHEKGERRALRPKHAASVYGVSRTLIYEWMKSGKLASVKLGGARLIPVDALEALLTGAPK